jgi:hypothetical protein
MSNHSRSQSRLAALLPDTTDPLVRGQAGLVLLTCGGLIVAALALILTWLISGDLEGVTVIAGLIFAALLVGIGLLARTGRVRAALWILTILLLLLIGMDVYEYGLGAPGAAGFFVPVLLAACGLGLWAGLGTAAISAALVWYVAWATTSGQYEPYYGGPVSIDHLTFNAPMYMVLFLLAALIAGGWTRHLSGLLADHLRA